MASITFDQLIPLYRNTVFNAAQTGGRLHIADHSTLDTLKFTSGRSNIPRAGSPANSYSVQGCLHRLGDRDPDR